VLFFHSSGGSTEGVSHYVHSVSLYPSHYRGGHTTYIEYLCSQATAQGGAGGLTLRTQSITSPLLHKREEWIIELVL